MGTLTYRDMLASYDELHDEYFAILNDYSFTDAKAISKLDALRWDALLLKEELENRSRWVTPNDVLHIDEKLESLMPDVESLIKDIKDDLAERASDIRQILHEAKL